MNHIELSNDFHRKQNFYFNFIDSEFLVSKDLQLGKNISNFHFEDLEINFWKSQNFAYTKNNTFGNIHFSFIRLFFLNWTTIKFIWKKPAKTHPKRIRGTECGVNTEKRVIFSRSRKWSNPENTVRVQSAIYSFFEWCKCRNLHDCSTFFAFFWTHWWKNYNKAVLPENICDFKNFSRLFHIDESSLISIIITRVFLIEPFKKTQLRWLISQVFSEFRKHF